MEVARRQKTAHMLIESKYKGKKTGTFGDLSYFSFYVTKNVVTTEGEMVLAKSFYPAKVMIIFKIS